MSDYTPISAIFALSKNGVIGHQNSLPWNIPEDLAHFKLHTLNHILIMGRKTYESLPVKPLPGRIHIVLTKNPVRYANQASESVYFFDCSDETAKGYSFETKLRNIIRMFHVQYPSKEFFIIGGADLIQQTHHMIDKAYVTYVDKQVNGDTLFFPPSQWKLAEHSLRMHSSIELCDYQYLTYVNQTPSSNLFQQGAGACADADTIYKNLIQDILQNGSTRDDRTGTGTLSVFGRQLRFDIQHSIPLLTTKLVGWKSVLKELLWFLKGQTDATILKNQGVGIWSGNTSREFLDSRGLNDLPIGDIGAGYGFQWRHFGAEYVNCSADYTQKGFDQIQTILDQLKNDPMSRRIFMSAWNPSALNRMALPPCHVSAQFYVSIDPSTQQKYLSCHMYQRSVDVFLGLPFNIMSYASLTYLLAAMTGMQPKELIISTGDTHIYKDHIDQVKSQLQRSSTPSPILLVNPEVVHKTIEDVQLDDFDVVGYFHHPILSGKMSV
jgi:thymidylate synthase